MTHEEQIAELNRQRNDHLTEADKLLIDIRRIMMEHEQELKVDDDDL